jgi:hypothetical protein
MVSREASLKKHAEVTPDILACPDFNKRPVWLLAASH